MTNLRSLLHRGAAAAAAAMALAGCAAQRPLGLACMDRFDIERFEMGCWAGRSGAPEQAHVPAEGRREVVPATFR